MKRNGTSNGVIRFAVLDDDPLVTETLRLGLGRLGGFTLVAAGATGRELLERIARLPADQRPDVVLLEIRLKELDGYTVCRALRKSWPGLLTVFHTTHRLPCFVNGARHAGADAYFCKPIVIRELAAELRALRRTNGLLIDERVLMGGATGSLVLARDPQFQGREEEVLELEAAGLSVGEISAKLGLHEQTIYRTLRAGMARARAATRPLGPSDPIPQNV